MKERKNKPGWLEYATVAVVIAAACAVLFTIFGKANFGQAQVANMAPVGGDCAVAREYTEARRMANDCCCEAGLANPDMIHGEMAIESLDGPVGSVREVRSYSPPAPSPRSIEPETPGYERYAEFKENEFLEAAREPLSTFSIDVDTASYTMARRFLTEQRRMPPRDSIRVEEFINYFDYGYEAPKDGSPVAAHCEMAACPWAPAHKLLRIGLQAKRLGEDEMPPSNLTFLIDVSGSMASPNSLPLLVKSMKLLVEGMRDQDYVSIVTYASGVGVRLEPTSGRHKDRINEVLDSLRAQGATSGGEGLQLAYREAKKNFVKGGNNRVILATDGDFNVGLRNDAELVRFIEGKRDEGIFLTVLGFGYGNYQDAKMKKIADAGNGAYAFIDNILEAKKVLMNEFAGTLFTVAKDVKVQVEFNPAKVGSYRLLGYESRLLKAKDFNDDKKDAGEMGAGHSVTALYEIVEPGADSSVPQTDALKYQKNTAVGSEEVLTVKFRYKKPDGDKSELKEMAFTEQELVKREPSEDFRFASAVAEVAMLLRDSALKGDASYAAAIKRAKNAKGRDENGYRAEFVRLAEFAELMEKDRRNTPPPRPRRNEYREDRIDSDPIHGDIDTLPL